MTEYDYELLCMTMYGYVRVQKMLNSSYEPNPEISNLTTFSETRQPDFGAKSIYFAI